MDKYRGNVSRRTDWRTPAPIFDFLNAHTPFQVDAAADETNHLVDIWYGPDGEAEDALQVNAWRTPAFCNPPYVSGVTWRTWLRHFDNQALRGNTVVSLLPAATGTRWWIEMIRRAESCPDVLFLSGRVPFVGPGNAPNHDSALVVWQPGTSLRVDWWDWRKDVYAKGSKVSRVPAGRPLLRLLETDERNQ